jgi:glycosyltransferase involved in cell wall biosynthesis
MPKIDTRLDTQAPPLGQREDTTPIRKVLVMVPALNEEESVGAVVTRVRAVLGVDVLVIDDGSSDQTATMAKTAGATVLRLPYNLGVGGAIRTGLRYAKANGYNRVVQIDADGQHDPREARRLLDELDRCQLDLVVGSRFAAGYDVGRSRRSTMRLLSKIVSRRVGTIITDTTSGFRAMGPKAIDLFSRQYPLDYLSDTVEAVLLAADAGLAIDEIDVLMHARQGGQPSNPSLRGAYHLGRLLVGIALRGYIRRQPKLPES